MKNIKKITLFLILVFICTFLLTLTGVASAAETPEIEAEAALLIEVDSGKVLFEMRADELRAPASITKMMTVLLAVEAIEKGDITLDDMVTATARANSDLSYDSSTQNIVEGETMPLEDLLYCALVASANEAANIIAEHVGGDVDTFVDMMNKRAKELGCKNTTFKNTHGLTVDGHMSTARDIALIAEEAMRHPIFMEICGTKSYVVESTNMSEERYFKNTNRLILTSGDPAQQFEYATGLKTGYTSAAGYCVAASAEKDGVRMICIILGASYTENEEGIKNPQSFNQAKKLLDWGYDSFAYIEIVEDSELIAEVPVALGVDTDAVIAKAGAGITALLPAELKPEDFTRTVTIYSERDGEKLEAPVKAGDVLGEMELSLDGTVYGTVQLVANTDVERSQVESFADTLNDLLTSKWLRISLVIIAVLIVLIIVFVIVYNIKRRKRRKIAWNINRGRGDDR